MIARVFYGMKTGFGFWSIIQNCFVLQARGHWSTHTCIHALMNLKTEA